MGPTLSLLSGGAIFCRVLRNRQFSLAHQLKQQIQNIGLIWQNAL
jgi:hypothetical protein